MSITKIHNGKWDIEIDMIDPTDSRDQHIYPYVPEGTWEFGKPVTPYLGLDTEFLVEEDKKILWPWEQKLPQERDTNNPHTTGDPRVYDFHGDGYATELCIIPNYCLELIMDNLAYSFRWLDSKRSKPNNSRRLKAPAIYSIPEEVEQAAPAVAKQLGCMPAINAYDDSGVPSSLAKNQRTTGCHLHISHPVLSNQDTALALVKWADILVGCAWTYISPNPSKAEAERRKAYGRAGEFRLKKYPDIPFLGAKYSYGVEYRVLPGTPIQHPAYLTLLYSLYRSALRLAARYGEPVPDLAFEAKEAINNAGKTEAKNVLRSLPISDGGRKLIRFLRRVPLKLEELNEWVEVGGRHKGHQSLYSEKKIASRRLSL